MLEGDTLVMTTSDRKRLWIVRQILCKQITQKKGAKLLRLSTRQIKRLCKRVGREGDEGVIHRNRGRKSNRRISSSLKRGIVQIVASRYRGFGPTLTSEQLKKHEGIEISKETVRRWLIENDLEYKGRRSRPHRRWREPKKYFGEMLQMDGSHHDWLEGRGPRMVMMGYVDDATGKAFARFCEYEGTLPAFDGLLGYAKKYGLPCSIYLDKHTTYKSMRKISLLDQLEGEPGTSQFQRAMKQLGIEVIHANSPQAKGRIERFFRTAQDRLVKLMRVDGISTLQAANRFLSGYLQDHNKRFSRPAAGTANLHRKLSLTTKDLKSILSVQTRRVVRNDFTIVHNGQLYQIDEHIHTRLVVVEERINGSIHLMDGKSELRFHAIEKPHRPEEKEDPILVGKKRRGRRTVPNLEWKKFRFGKLDPAKGDISTLLRR
jgi:transposase